MLAVNKELRNNELLLERMQLYSLIEEGLDQIKQGKVRPMKDVIKSIRTKINQ